MTRPKYANDDERRAAQRELRRQRNDMIRALLEEHRARASMPAFTSSGVTPRTSAERILSSPDFRLHFINALVKNHYAEVREALEAYRLINGTEK